MSTRRETRPRIWATAAAVVGFAMVVIYLAVIVTEGTNDLREIAPWTLAMAVPATLSLVGANLETDQKARALLLVSAVLFFGIGVLGIFSIGIGFLVAGALALFGAIQLPRSG